MLIRMQTRSLWKTCQSTSDPLCLDTSKQERSSQRDRNSWIRQPRRGRLFVKCEYMLNISDSLGLLLAPKTHGNCDSTTGWKQYAHQHVFTSDGRDQMPNLKAKSQILTGSRIFIAALFLVARIWKKPGLMPLSGKKHFWGKMWCVLATEPHVIISEIKQKSNMDILLDRENYNKVR